MSDAARAVGARVASSAAVIAIAVWAGGLLALGAVVAPVVFGMVPAPTSADAMTVVFRRFDGVAVVCAIVALAAEVALAVTRRPLLRRDLGRGGLVVLAAALALAEAAWITPKITALHAAGAVRGDGALGLELEMFHARAETMAKIELFAALAALVLHAVASPPRDLPTARPGAGTTGASRGTADREEDAERAA